MFLWNLKKSLLQVQDRAQAWCHAYIIPATRKVEMGGFSSRLALTKVSGILSPKQQVMVITCNPVYSAGRVRGFMD
jgi:hypothetical protein